MIPPLRSREVPQETVTLKLRKILVIDEALPVRRALLDTFHKLGIPASDVVGITDAEEALERFARLNPALVFSEFVGETPDVGLGMIREMLALDPHCKVILVTAEPRDSPHVRAAIRAGAFALLEKPLRHEKIRQCLLEIENEAGGIERYR